MVLLEKSATFSIKSRLSSEEPESPDTDATVTVSLAQLRLSRTDSCRADETASELVGDQSGSEMPSGLDHYTPVCTIGTGTFGRVYLVRRNSSNRQFAALKVMKMKEVIKSKQVQHVHNEKTILQAVEHPFITRLLTSWKDDFSLFLLFAYVPGGELFSHLRLRGHFSPPVAKFYAAEILLALEYLHNRHIIFRDLKPENLLLQKDGHLILTDFGFAKELRDRTWTLCGTPEYLAPEVVECRGHNKAVDYWAFGVIIYEMLAGYAPFLGSNPLQIYEKILDGKPKYPSHFDLVAKYCLLQIAPDILRYAKHLLWTKRFGNMKNGANDVKNHKWFDGVDWILLNDKGVVAPIIPKVAHDGDTGNFDKYDEENLASGGASLPLSELAEFCNW